MELAEEHGVANYILKAQTGHINISPTGFQLAAQDYFKCYLDFQMPGRFSIVPYFLCCRAIELSLKAKHLEIRSRQVVKQSFGHNLIKSYQALPSEKQSLSSEEFQLLQKANEIYNKKEFEYFSVLDAATGFTRYPDLNKLADITRKLIDYKS